MVGLKTMKVSLQRNSATSTRTRGDLRDYLHRPSQSRRVAVAIDPHGKLHYGQDNAGADHIVAVCGGTAFRAKSGQIEQDRVGQKQRT